MNSKENHQCSKSSSDDVVGFSDTEQEARNKGRCNSKENKNEPKGPKGFWCRVKWDKWIASLCAVLMVVIVGIQAYFVFKTNQITIDALIENTRQFEATLQEIREQTVAFQTAAAAIEESARAAIKVANATESQVAVAHGQMRVHMRHKSMSLEKRCVWIRGLGWVTKSMPFKLESVAHPSGRTGEPKTGEQFRFRLFIQNVGKTPALNVQFMTARPIMIPIGDTPNAASRMVDR